MATIKKGKKGGEGIDGVSMIGCPLICTQYDTPCYIQGTLCLSYPSTHEMSI